MGKKPQTNQDLILSSPVCCEIGFSSFEQNFMPKFYLLLCSLAIRNDNNISAWETSITQMPAATEIPHFPVRLHVRTYFF